VEPELAHRAAGPGSAARALPGEVAARARTENFPVASLLFPRPLRPHLRAIYGFARLVDILGDEAEGDRLALLDEPATGLCPVALRANQSSRRGR
jgi:Squalene/phytoene synthase